jgi:hypothetical protein
LLHFRFFDGFQISLGQERQYFYGWAIQQGISVNNGFNKRLAVSYGFLKQVFFGGEIPVDEGRRFQPGGLTDTFNGSAAIALVGKLIKGRIKDALVLLRLAARHFLTT